MNNTCRVCTTEIKQMCRKNTGICGEICEKAEKKSKSLPEAYSVDDLREIEGFPILRSAVCPI